MQQPYQCYRIITRNKLSLVLGITSKITSAPASKGPLTGAGGREGGREGRMLSAVAEHPVCCSTHTSDE